MKLTLDLHDIYNKGAEIEKALQRVFDEAVAKKAPMIEIIPGKGSPAEEARAEVPRPEAFICEEYADREALQELRHDQGSLQLE